MWKTALSVQVNRSCFKSILFECCNIPVCTKTSLLISLYTNVSFPCVEIKYKETNPALSISNKPFKSSKSYKTFYCTIALLISKLSPYSTDVGRKHIQFSALQLFLSNEKKTFMCMEQLLSHSPPFVTFLQKRPFIWCCCLKFTVEGAFCVAAK